MYPLIKYIHVTAAGLSLAGFLLRWWWRRRASERGHPRLRGLPHVNDSVLLAAGVALAWTGGWSPLEHGWLGTKLAALVAYVPLGALALRGATAAVRSGAFVAAVIVFLYIVAVAATRQTGWW